MLGCACIIAGMRKLLLSFAFAAAVAFGAEITGTWNFSVETDAGSGNPVFHLKQDGEKLTGTYKGLLGEADVTGSVKGNEVVIEWQNEQVGRIRYTGTLDADAASMKGKVLFGNAGSGTFTARKK
jgi:hypothetical protein